MRNGQAHTGLHAALNDASNEGASLGALLKMQNCFSIILQGIGYGQSIPATGTTPFEFRPEASARLPTPCVRPTT